MQIFSNKMEDNMNGKNHHIPVDADDEEWEKQLGPGGIVKNPRRKPGEEFRGREPKGKQNHSKVKRTEKIAMNDKKTTDPETQQTPIESLITLSPVPTATPDPAQKPAEKIFPSPKIFPFLVRIRQIASLQQERDGYQEELKKLQLESAKVQKALLESESKIYIQLDAFGGRDLEIIQSQLLSGTEEDAKSIREALASFGDIAEKAKQTKLSFKINNYMKTAEAFRVIWQALTKEERDERALSSRIAPDNVKPFYRAALASKKEEAAEKFLNMIPPAWKEEVAGKISVPAAEEPKTI